MKALKCKTIFTSILLLAVTFSIAQDKPVVSPQLPVDPDTKKIMYRGVVDEPGTPVYLYDKAIEWFGYYYPSPSSVYTIQDKVNGKIEGQGRMKIFFRDEKTEMQRDAGQVVYQIRLEFKENRYRYTVTDFNLKGTSRYPVEKWMNKSDPAYNPSWEMFLYQVDTTMQRLVTTLKEQMKPKVIKKDEW